MLWEKLALMPPPVTQLVLGWVALANEWVGEFAGFTTTFTCFPTQQYLVNRTDPTWYLLSVLDDDEAEGETGLPVQNTARYQCVFFTLDRSFYSSTTFGQLRLHDSCFHVGLLLIAASLRLHFKSISWRPAHSSSMVGDLPRFPSSRSPLTFFGKYEVISTFS